VNGRLAVVIGAYVAGLSGVILGVVVWSSPTVVGVALAWLTVVGIYAWRAFRCPLCGASVFNAPARAAVRWVIRTPRLCPRCRADYDAALVELRRGARRVSR
jgi:hypothetical protein